jgi:multimeric flavodoxin WrbA
MNIVALVGSNRKKGNTAGVIHLVGERLRAEAARRGVPLTFDTIYLGDADIRPCRGCRVCFNRGEEKCPLKDDTLAIKARLHEADAIILGSPVYVGDVSGIVKTWIDRMAHVCHRPEFAGKCVYLIATTGGSATRHTLHTMQGAWISWGAHLVGWAGFKLGALTGWDEIAARHGRQIDRIARRLFRAAHTRAGERPRFAELMVFKIQQFNRSRGARDTVDYRYWRDQGWTNPRRTYFIPHRGGRAQVALARLVGGIMARLFA